MQACWLPCSIVHVVLHPLKMQSEFCFVVHIPNLADFFVGRWLPKRSMAKSAKLTSHTYQQLNQVPCSDCDAPSQSDEHRSSEQCGGFHESHVSHAFLHLSPRRSAPAGGNARSSSACCLIVSSHFVLLSLHLGFVLYTAGCLACLLEVDLGDVDMGGRTHLSMFFRSALSHNPNCTSLSTT